MRSPSSPDTALDDILRRGPVQNPSPRPFARSVGEQLLNQNTPAKFEHSEYEEQKQRSDESKLDSRRTSFLSERSPELMQAEKFAR